MPFESVLLVGFGREATGFGRVTSSIASALIDRHDVMQFALDLAAAPAECRRWPIVANGVRFDPLGLEKLAETIERYRPDVVWIINDFWWLQRYAGHRRTFQSFVEIRRLRSARRQDPPRPRARVSHSLRRCCRLQRVCPSGHRKGPVRRRVGRTRGLRCRRSGSFPTASISTCFVRSVTATKPSWHAAGSEDFLVLNGNQNNARKRIGHHPAWVREVREGKTIRRQARLELQHVGRFEAFPRNQCCQARRSLGHRRPDRLERVRNGACRLQQWRIEPPLQSLCGGHQHVVGGGLGPRELRTWSDRCCADRLPPHGRRRDLGWTRGVFGDRGIAAQSCSDASGARGEHGGCRRVARAAVSGQVPSDRSRVEGYRRDQAATIRLEHDRTCLVVGLRGRLSFVASTRAPSSRSSRPATASAPSSRSTASSEAAPIT